MNPIQKSDSIRRTVREHEDLHRRLSEIRARVEAVSSGSKGGDPAASLGGLLAALGEFRTLLAAHFAFEEETGLPDELALKVPHLSEKALALRGEHQEILRDLAALSEQGRRTAPSRPEEMAGFGDRVLGLISEISRHEKNETKLIQDAYLDDLGSPD